MLFKNDERIKGEELAPKSWKGEGKNKSVNPLLEFKKPVVFRLTERHFYDDPDNNRKKVAPRRVLVETRYTIFNKDAQQSQEIRYAVTAVPRDKGIFHYSPEYLQFDQNGQLIVQPDNPDLYYTLLYSPFRKGSPYADQREIVFELEDKAAEARLKADKTRKKLEATLMIYGEKALSDDLLRDIAKGFLIANVDDLEIDEVRNQLEDIANTNPDNFIQNTAGATLTVRAVIQNAVDLGIISYIGSKRAWHMLKDDGSVGDELMQVRPGEEAVTRLTDFMLNYDKQGLCEYLTELVQEKKKKVA